MACTTFSLSILWWINIYVNCYFRNNVDNTEPSLSVSHPVSHLSVSTMTAVMSLCSGFRLAQASCEQCGRDAECIRKEQHILSRCFLGALPSVLRSLTLWQFPVFSLACLQLQCGVLEVSFLLLNITSLFLCFNCFLLNSIWKTISLTFI